MVASEIRESLILASRYDAYGLVMIGVPVAILGALILLVLLIRAVVNTVSASSSRNLKFGLTVLGVMYLILCPGLSGGIWFDVSSQDTTTAEYSWLLMVSFGTCCLLVMAIAGVGKRAESGERRADSEE